MVPFGSLDLGHLEPDWGIVNVYLFGIDSVLRLIAVGDAPIAVHRLIRRHTIGTVRTQPWGNGGKRHHACEQEA